MLAEGERVGLIRVYISFLYALLSGSHLLDVSGVRGAYRVESGSSL